MIWIFVLSLVILLSAVIATVVRKTGTQLAWGKILGWLGVIVVIVAISLTVKSCQGEKKQRRSVDSATLRQSNLRDWYWKLPNGQMTSGGRSENASYESEAEVIREDRGTLWFNVYYTEYGEREATRYRVSCLNGVWSGSWEQERPRQSGNLTLDRDPVSGSYSGVMTWTGTNLSARCRLIKRR